MPLPHAELVVDRFHLFKKANEVARAVRRRVTHTHRGRRGRKSDVEWRGRRRLLRGAETLPEKQRTELFTKLLASDPSEEIAAAWIAKELLRDLLACTARGGLRHEIRAALYRFYKFCAACSVPEVTALARTVETWQDPIVQAIETGLSNARGEGFGPDLQARRADRIRVLQPRQSTSPGAVGLHAPLPAEHTQPASMPPLTAKSLVSS